MKHLTTILLFFVSIVISAQDINQFDANGNRHGIWKKNFEGTKQLRYQGEFVHGKEVSEFKFYKLIKKKSILTAVKQFNDKDNSAYVKFLASNGKVISEGKMLGKLYVGKWIYFHKNSSKVMTLENYNDNGILHGDRIVYYKDGQIAEEANYVNGSLEGISKWYSKKGIEIKIFVYENNELHGMSKYYSEEGEILAEGAYKRGKKKGVWKYYNNGKLVKKKDFTYKPKYIKKQ
jgi:antitoxin component YwqK of YwqJK toxin-antitoxin module